MATKTYLLCGLVFAGKNVWELQDDGTTISYTGNSWLINDASWIPYVVKRDYDGNYYFGGDDGRVYKYSSSMVLDTTWGTGGYVTGNSSAIIYSIDLDPNGYLAVGQNANSGLYRTFLFNGSGVKQWEVNQGTNPGDGFTTANGVRFTVDGDIAQCHSRNSGESTGAILNRADGSVKQHLHTAGGDAHPSSCEYLPELKYVALAWGPVSGGGLYVAVREEDNTSVWLKTVAGLHTVQYEAVAFDSNNDLYFGTNPNGDYTIHKLDIDSAGDVLAQYDTGGSVFSLQFNDDGELVSCDTTANQDSDGDTQLVRVFNTDLVKQRGWKGDGVVTPNWAKSICTGETRVFVQPQLPDMKLYSKALVVACNNQIWHESTPGTMTQFTDADDDINTNAPFFMVEAFQKAFIANQTNLKVYDRANTKISTADAGATACVKGTILTGVTSGAQMVVDYASGVTDDAAALIYGVRTTTATFQDTETVTGDGGQSFVLDAAEVAPPHWYSWTPFGNDTTTYGSMPSRAYILCLYRGRLVLAGHNHYPHLWWMSKLDNPWMWLYDSTDPLSAVAGNNVDAGEVGDIIRAMIPNGDDFLLFGCANSFWILRGDPIEGGSIDKIDDKIGIYSPWSWCQDSQRNTYFYGTGGFWKIDNEGGGLQNLSFNKLPALVDEWSVDPSLHRITVSYDPQRHGITISKVTLATGANEGYFYSLITEGFYPENYAVNCGVFSSFYYESDDPNYKHLVLGGTDGFLRYFSDSAKDDDAGLTGDVAINSYFTLSPQKLGEGDNQEGVAHNFCFTVGGGASGGAYADSDGFTYEFHVADDAETLAENVLDGDTARESGSFTTTGRQNRIRKRVRGLWFTCKCYNNTANQSWCMNRLTFDIKPVGNK